MPWAVTGPRAVALVAAALLAGACSGGGVPVGEGTGEPRQAPTAGGTASPVPGTSEDGPAGALVVGEGFTVLLPSAPDVQTVDLPVADGTTGQATTYQAQQDGVFVGFSYADLAGAVPQDDAAARAALQDGARSTALDVGGTVTDLEDRQAAGRPAVAYAIELPVGEIRGVSFYDGARLYTVQAADPTGGTGDVPAVLESVVATISLDDAPGARPGQR